MLTLANVVWGARCGESARRVLLGETRSSGQAYSVRGARESAVLRQAPHRLPSSRLVSTNILDEWFEEVVKPRMKGEAHKIRFADDAILCFEHKGDAEKGKEVLTKARRKDLATGTILSDSCDAAATPRGGVVAWRYSEEALAKRYRRGV